MAMSVKSLTCKLTAYVPCVWLYRTFSNRITINATTMFGTSISARVGVVPGSRYESRGGRGGAGGVIWLGVYDMFSLQLHNQVAFLNTTYYNMQLK